MYTALATFFEQGAVLNFFCGPLLYEGAAASRAPREMLILGWWVVYIYRIPGPGRRSSLHTWVARFFRPPLYIHYSTGPGGRSTFTMRVARFIPPPLIILVRTLHDEYAGLA